MQDNETFLICGLGNPGARYQSTYHNCGYMALDRLAEGLKVRVNKARFKGAYALTHIKERRVILLKPETYMNLSGESLRAAMDYFKISPDHVLVIYDDIDLGIGSLRFRMSGGAGTHNGMRSILQHLGQGDFNRLRIGIGPVPSQRELADYVLDNVGQKEAPALFWALDLAADAALIWMERGAERAMQFVNRQKYPEPQALQTQEGAERSIKETAEMGQG